MANIDPKYKTKVEESFKRQGLMRLINAELVQVGSGTCSIRVPFQPSLTQQHGFFHAGIISTLGDNATGYAAFSLMDVNSSVLTVEFKINFVAPAKGDHLLAVGNVVKNGRTLKICQAEIFAIDKGEKKLCALLQATIMEMHNSSDS